MEDSLFSPHLISLNKKSLFSFSPSFIPPHACEPFLSTRALSFCHSSLFLRATRPAVHTVCFSVGHVIPVCVHVCNSD